MYPTPKNPVVLTLKGHIPAFKNEKIPIVTGGKPRIITAPAVQKWIRAASEQAQVQWVRQQERHSFTTILIPDRVFVYVMLTFFSTSPSVIPPSDDDNAYSTIQEILQSPDKDGGVLGIMQDDKQVFSHFVVKQLTANRFTQHAQVFVWAKDDRSEMDQLSEFMQHRENIVNNSQEFGSDLPEWFDSE